MEKQDIAERVFSWVETAAQNISDFAKEEIPPFIHEFLTWKFFENAFDAGWFFAKILLFFVIAFVAYMYGKRNYKKMIKVCIEEERRPRDSEECFAFIPMIVSGVIALFTFMSLFIGFPKKEIKNMIQIKTAPKVYLVEEAAKIIKK